jgi:GNAT superfamily N-acetyltransferase
VSLWRKVIRRLARAPRLEYLILIRRRLDGTLPAYAASMPLEFAVLPCDADVVERQLAHLPAEHRPDIADRLGRGHLCCVVKHNGQVIWVTWIAIGTYHSYLLDRDYELAPDVGCSYGSYTLPEFRGLGLHTAAMNHRLHELRERGFRQFFAFIEPENRAAMRPAEKLGYERVGATGFIEIFGVRWYFHRDGGAFAGLKRRYYWRKV